MIRRDAYASSPRLQLAIGEQLWGRVLLYIAEQEGALEADLVDQFVPAWSEGALRDAVYLLVAEEAVVYDSGKYSLTATGERMLRDC